MLFNKTGSFWITLCGVNMSNTYDAISFQALINGAKDSCLPTSDKQHRENNHERFAESFQGNHAGLSATNWTSDHDLYKDGRGLATDGLHHGNVYNNTPFSQQHVSHHHPHKHEHPTLTPTFNESPSMYAPFQTAPMWTEHKAIRNEDMGCRVDEHQYLMDQEARWAFVPRPTEETTHVWDGTTYASERWLLPKPDLFPRGPVFCNPVLRDMDEITEQSGERWGRVQTFSGLQL
jgi:hypothetical protein